MMKNKKINKKWLICFAVLALIVAIVIFCIWLPLRNKTKAPVKESPETKQTEIPAANNRNNQESNVSAESQGSSSLQTTQNNSITTETIIEPANPDSSSTINTPQSTDYNQIKGSQFDERN